ncbi:MAG: SprT-like domain-containing protein [Nanoarchaeota archaeon]
MDILKKAFVELDLKDDFSFKISYSGKFKGYNANAKYTKNSISFNLSKNWLLIDEDIKLGLIQTLLCKIFKIKKTTLKMNLYENFIKSVHLSTTNPKSDPILEFSFNKINEIYFDNFLEKPNLIFGRESFRQFGSYDYGTDTISINPLLKNHKDVLDYVMYHEMLHKKFKFNTKNNRSFHHTKEFKKEEDKFLNKKEIEQKLTKISKKKKYGSLFNWFCF